MTTTQKNSTAAFRQRLRAFEGRPLVTLEGLDASPHGQSGPAIGSTAAFRGRLRAHAGLPPVSLTALED